MRLAPEEPAPSLPPGGDDATLPAPRVPLGSTFSALVGPEDGVALAPVDALDSVELPAPPPRALNLAFMEMAALFAAFVVPQICVYAFFNDDRRAFAMPFAGLASGLLVLIVGSFSRALDGALLRFPRPARFAEALVVAVVFLGVAYALHAVVTHFDPDADDPLRPIVQTLGLPGALFVVAFCPGVFEELAFRGVIQGRLLLLYGRPAHIVLTALGFALAHGITFGLPIHFGLGVVLCFMRERSQSLWPGVVTHVVYNGAIVCALAQN